MGDVNEEWLPSIEVRPCESYEMGWLIGQRFSSLIQSRVSKDQILQEEMLPFAMSADGQCLIEALSTANRYLVKAKLEDGDSFTAYTYAGELPTCAFGFNSHGVAFTLDSVPPSKEEVTAGGIGRNFVSRDLLEAVSIKDALRRVHLPNLSVGHSYNLIDVRMRRLLNVETASKNRISVMEIDQNPFFHANSYLHLQVSQTKDEMSTNRQKRAAELPKLSQKEILSIMGDTSDAKYPIYSQGPTLWTLCTIVIDLDQKILAIYRGNPKLQEVVLKFSLLQGS